MKIVVNLTSVPFVLGLIVELEDCYIVTSNRESGFGRYDIMMLPKKEALPGIIMDLRSMEKMY